MHPGQDRNSQTNRVTEAGKLKPRNHNFPKRYANEGVERGQRSFFFNPGLPGTFFLSKEPFVLGKAYLEGKRKEEGQKALKA